MWSYASSFVPSFLRTVPTSTPELPTLEDHEFILQDPEVEDPSPPQDSTSPPQDQDESSQIRELIDELPTPPTSHHSTPTSSTFCEKGASKMMVPINPVTLEHIHAKTTLDRLDVGWSYLMEILRLDPQPMATESMVPEMSRENPVEEVPEESSEVPVEEIPGESDEPVSEKPIEVEEPEVEEPEVEERDKSESSKSKQGVNRFLINLTNYVTTKHKATDSCSRCLRSLGDLAVIQIKSTPERFQYHIGCFRCTICNKHVMFQVFGISKYQLYCNKHMPAIEDS